MRVTPLSKIVAAIVFITLPFAGFLFGVEYGKLSVQSNSNIEFEKPSLKPNEVMCTMDAKICPDGSSVGRVAPTCEFAECPLPNVQMMQ